MGKRGLIALVAIASLLWSGPVSNSVQAAAGDLDLSFGNGGRVTTDFGGSDEAHAMAIQGDGKIVVAGFIFGGNGSSESRFAVARYNPDGSLDSSFGSGGKVTTDFDGFSEEAHAVAIQNDGKILVAGFADNSVTGFDFAVARYNSNGNLDTSFGSGGKVTTDFFGASEFASAMAIQNNGKIVVAGGASTSLSFDFALARYNPDGSLDSTFGAGGKATTDFGIPTDLANAVAIQSDGKIVAAGVASNILFDFALARYNPNGSLDSTFGAGGKVTTDFGGLSDVGEGLAIQADGKIVVAGSVGENSPFMDSDFGLVRYNSNGSLDASFGSGGKVTTDISHSPNEAHAIAIQSSGKIVLAGLAFNSGTTRDFALARYNSNGSLDSTFGSGGTLTTDFPDFFSSLDEAFAVAVQSDGKIVAAGFADHILGGGKNFALARYAGGSAFNLCIQDDSNGNILQINTTTGEYQFTNCAGLTLGGTGTLTKRGSTITLQHNASDRRVIATIDTSTNRATASIQLLSQGRMFSITDRNITNNPCACK